MKEHTPDPYQVLHLEPAATAGEVARAYRALMRTHHPDTTPSDAVPADWESRAQELRDIMDAYAVLGDPAKRAAYDSQRRPPTPAHVPPNWPPTPAHVPPSHPTDLSGAALLIGPVQREFPSGRGLDNQVIGSPGPARWTLLRATQAGPSAAPAGYRILLWIHR